MAASSLKRTNTIDEEDEGAKRVARSSSSGRFFVYETLNKALEESRKAIVYARKTHPDDHLAHMNLVDARLKRFPQRTAKRIFAMYVIMMGSFPAEKPHFCSVGDWEELVKRYKERTLFSFRYDSKNRIVTLVLPDVYDAYILSIVTCGPSLTKLSNITSRKNWWANANLGEFGYLFNKTPPAHLAKVYHLGMVDCEKSFFIPEYLLNDDMFNIALNFSTQDQNHVCLVNAFAHVFWNVMKQYITEESIEILRAGNPYQHSLNIVTIAPFDDAVRIGCLNACQAK